MKKVIVLLSVVLLLVSVYAIADAGDCGAVSGKISQLKQIGFIGKIEYANYYVDEASWMYLNVDQKGAFLSAFAYHYENCNGGVYRATVYSYQSGRKLAKTSSWGHKFY